MSFTAAAGIEGFAGWCNLIPSKKI